VLWAGAAVTWAAGLCWLSWQDWRGLAVRTSSVRLVGLASGAWFVAGSALSRDWRMAVLGTVCALLVGGALAAWSLSRPGQLGFGDVRVATLMAFGAGAVSPSACLVAAPVACLVAALSAKARKARSRGGGGQAAPLVPFLALAGLVVVASAA